MNREEHRALRESLGAYALGHLDADTAPRVRAHLDGCAACRSELAEIESVLPALRGVDPEALDRMPSPPPDLGDRIVSRARDEGAARPAVRSRFLAAAAVTLVALAGAGVGFAVGASDAADPVPRETIALRSVAPGVAASAVAIPHSWGVEITLDADGFVPGAVYRVVVRDDGGRPVNAGEFVGTGDSAMRCNLNSSVLRANASGFDVVDDRGSIVVHGDL